MLTLVLQNKYDVASNVRMCCIFFSLIGSTVESLIVFRMQVWTDVCTGRQLLESRKIGELRERLLVPSEFSENYKLSALWQAGVVVHSQIVLNN